MVYMRFEQQVISIARYVRPNRQTMMWISRRPRNLYRLVDALLKLYVEIRIEMYPASPYQSVEHEVLVTAEAEKKPEIVALLEHIFGRASGSSCRKNYRFCRNKEAR
ncbi:hypothetical protein MRX96_051492 [Rhipicephalus microplus]